jgi:hypothetical protein
MRSTRKPLLCLVLLGMAVAVPALAQGPAPYPAACDASKVSKVDVERAHTVFLSGKGFLDESNYDKAISYFKDAYSIDCSVHGILPIIATAYERKGDKAEAIRALGEYILRVPNTPDREVIERRIRNLREQLAQERPSATAVVTAPTTTATTAPTATTTATAETSATAPPPPTVPTGGPPPPEAEHSVVPWVMVGVGGALVVTGAILLVAGSGKVSSANSACPSHTLCDPGVASEGNQGRTFETVGVVGGIVGIVGVGAGLIWHFTEGGTATAGATTTHGTYVSPVVTPGFAGMSLGGSF